MTEGTVSTALSASQPQLHPHYVEGAQLGDEITELCGYIYAATYRLLVLIHEFDKEGYWPRSIVEINEVVKDVSAETSAHDSLLARRADAASRGDYGLGSGCGGAV